MDEPTDGLDPNQKHEVRQLIRRMGEKKAIIFSTHILEEVDAACTRAIIINTPSNPSGKVYSKEELKALRDICVDNDLFCFTEDEEIKEWADGFRIQKNGYPSSDHPGMLFITNAALQRDMANSKSVRTLRKSFSKEIEKLRYQSRRGASEIPKRKEGFAHCDILEGLLVQEERPFHRPHRFRCSKSGRGFEIQGWTFLRGRNWGK
jgi:ABC-type multidrug transport system ATPase subunit